MSMNVNIAPPSCRLEYGADAVVDSAKDPRYKVHDFNIDIGIANELHEEWRRKHPQSSSDAPDEQAYP